MCPLQLRLPDAEGTPPTVTPVAHGSLRRAVLPPLLMIISGASLYTGAAVAVGLFAHFPPAVVAWMRIAAAAVILLAVVRPRLSAFRGRDGLIAGLYGLVTAAMNMTFYEAIARLPLGTAVAVEFLGPILVAAAAMRSWRHAASILAAGVGVWLIADVQLSGSPVGMAFILAAAALWAGYILLGARVASGSAPRDGMTVGFLYASVLTSPILLTATPSAVTDGPGWVMIISLALGLGTLSAVIPYGLDQYILVQAGKDYFAILLALLPLTATAIGFIALGQQVSLAEGLGIAAIVLAVLLRAGRETGTEGVQPLVEQGLAEPPLDPPEDTASTTNGPRT